MKRLILLFSILFMFEALALERCSPQFTSVQEKQTYLESLIASKTKSKKANAKTYNKYKSLKSEHPTIAATLDESSVYDVIIDEEFLVTAKSLDQVLEKLKVSATENPSFSPAKHVKEVLKEHLKGKVPTASIEGRIDEFMNGGSIFRALGEKTVDETAVMFHGGNHLAPTADSILGKFIADHQASSVTRAFSHGPGYTTFGQDKLVVAVDQSMMKDFTAMMGDSHLFAHYHTPGQGTLNVLHEDEIHHWYSSQNNTKLSTATYLQNGTILPTVFLSSTEAQRMTQYMKGLSNGNIREHVKAPWLLEGYCAKGGYDSCTHWVGNIPIGDEVSNAYTFPGYIDNYASNQILDDVELDKLPRTQDLAPYKLPKGLKTPDRQQLQRIWKTPGNQQLSYLFGIGKANEYGQLANPGWVAHIFTSRIKVNRSPVVFVFVEDAKQPLAADFDLQISAH